MSGGREHILNPTRQTLSASVSPPLHLGIHKKSEFNYLFLVDPALILEFIRLSVLLSSKLSKQWEKNLHTLENYIDDGGRATEMCLNIKAIDICLLS